jgi:uncharacterized membrane protein
MIKIFHGIWSTPHPFLQNQFNRRILVFLNIFLMIIIAILTFYKFEIFSIFLSGILIAIASYIVIATRNMAQATDSETDERERKLRDHSHRIASWIFGLFFSMLIGTLSNILTNLKLHNTNAKIIIDLSNISQIQILIFTIIFATPFVMLTTWIIAWLEPTPLKD